MFDLRGWEFTIANDLQQLRGFAIKIANAELVAQIDEVSTWLKGRSFSIAVVGEFKRGKSTFINALLGREILPADVAPASATINRVVYGMPPLVRVFFKSVDGQPGHVVEIGIDQMADYVTKLTPEAAKTAATVSEAVVYYPSQYCQNNVSIIDTPGLNDDEAMSRVTLDVLPKVDAAVMVVMANAPFSHFEGDFLGNLLGRALGRVFFVVTAIDRIRKQDEREKILATIAERIRGAVEKRAAEQYSKDSEAYHDYCQRYGKPRVFGLSGADALDAKQTNDAELLAQSGFQAFENTLTTFLQEDRGAVALKVLAERVAPLAEQLVQGIDLQRGAIAMREADFDRLQHQAAAAMNEVRQRSEPTLLFVSAAARRAQEQIRGYLDALGPWMINAASQVIDFAPITPADLNKANIDAVASLGKNVLAWGQRKIAGTQAAQTAAPAAADTSTLGTLSRYITEEIGKVAQYVAEQMQQIIQQELVSENDRLREFTRSAEQTLRSSTMQFAQSTEEGGPARSTVVQSSDQLALMPDFGLLWSGSHNAGLRSAAMGSIQSIGSVVNDGWQRMFALAGNPNQLRQPSQDRVTIFKTTYKQSISESVNQYLQQTRPDLAVNQQIEIVFGRLQQRAQADIAAVLDRQHQTLESLRRNRDQAALLSERDRGELATMQAEAQRIASQTGQLAAQLSAIVEERWAVSDA